jgi:hypothetical protein
MTVQNTIFVIYYINTDEPECSEVLNTYTCKDRAIKKLIEVAGYRQDTNSNLTQYFRPTYDYTSYDQLYALVEENMELVDEDIYRIYETPVI